MGKTVERDGGKYTHTHKEVDPEILPCLQRSPEGRGSTPLPPSLFLWGVGGRRRMGGGLPPPPLLLFFFWHPIFVVMDLPPLAIFPPSPFGRSQQRGGGCKHTHTQKSMDQMHVTLIDHQFDVNSGESAPAFEPNSIGPLSPIISHFPSAAIIRDCGNLFK